MFRGYKVYSPVKRDNCLSFQFRDTENSQWCDIFVFVKFGGQNIELGDLLKQKINGLEEFQVFILYTSDTSTSGICNSFLKAGPTVRNILLWILLLPYFSLG